MKLAVVGVGQAGGRIATTVSSFSSRLSSGSSFVGPIAVNAAEADLAGLDLPAEQTVLIGADRLNGGGTGTDNHLGAEVAETDIEAVHGSVDQLPTYDIDAFLVVAGLGGGTGSGGAPVIARHLRISYDLPVYALGVLPGRSEVSLHTVNAVESLKTLQTTADNTLVFANDALTPSGEPAQEQEQKQEQEQERESYTQLNREIARRVQMICTAGAPDTVADTQLQPQQVVDASEVIQTLEHDTTSTIGLAAATVDTQARTDGGVLARISDVLSSRDEDDPEPTAEPAEQAGHAIETLTRKAVFGSTALTDPPTAQSALLLVSGPPDELDRAGLGEAQSWLSDVTGTAAVRTGDLPVAGSTLRVLVLLSGVATPLSRWIDQQAADGLPPEGTDAVEPLFE